jgi:hypothetical protein
MLLFLLHFAGMALDLHSELLSEPVDLPVSPGCLQTLSTVQLALVAARPDLDTLTRQRAYGLYLVRQVVYTESDPKDRRAERR